MNEGLFKALSLILALIIVGGYIFAAVFVFHSLEALVVPAIGFSLVFIFLLYLNQNPIPPLKGPLILRCPKCGIELTIDAEFCPQCGKKLPRYNKDLGFLNNI